MNKPKRKRQPTAECYREQLALAANEIIDLRSTCSAQQAITGAALDLLAMHKKARLPWWRRIFRKP